MKKKIFEGNDDLIEKLPLAVRAYFVMQAQLSITFYNDNAYYALKDVIYEAGSNFPLFS